MFYQSLFSHKHQHHLHISHSHWQPTWTWNEMPYKLTQKKSNYIKDLCILNVQTVVHIKTLCNSEAKWFGMSGKDGIFCNSQQPFLKPALHLLFSVPTEKKHYSSLFQATDRNTVIIVGSGLNLRPPLESSSSPPATLSESSLS